MDNLNPLPEPPEELPTPEVVQRPPLEVHSHDAPPIEYRDAHEEGKKILILTLVAATLLGSTIVYLLHRKPAPPPAAPVAHVTAKPKHPAVHKHAHKTHKKAAKKSSSHKPSADSKSHSRPWFSSHETNG